MKLRGDFHNETLWATQADMAQVFGVTPQNVTIHLRHIYKDKELNEKATCKESLQVQKEGAQARHKATDPGSTHRTHAAHC